MQETQAYDQLFSDREEPRVNSVISTTQTIGGFMDFHHLGVVCKSLEAGRSFFNSTLGIDRWSKEFSDPIQKVDVQFGKSASGPLYELIAPNAIDAPITATLKSRTNILNHLAYIVPVMEQAFTHLRGAGCMPVTEPQPAVAFNGARIQFFYSPMNFIIELIERIDASETFPADEFVASN
jgi:methylmalonyl-CoA/ethylmalonyl-CoA epimerase